MTGQQSIKNSNRLFKAIQNNIHKKQHFKIV